MCSGRWSGVGCLALILSSSISVCAQSEVAVLLSEECSVREREIITLHYGIGRRDGIPITLEVISQRYTYEHKCTSPTVMSEHCSHGGEGSNAQ